MKLPQIIVVNFTEQCECAGNYKQVVIREDRAGSINTWSENQPIMSVEFATPSLLGQRSRDARNQLEYLYPVKLFQPLSAL